MPDYSFLANPTAPQQGINTLNSLLQAKGQSLENQYKQETLPARVQQQTANTQTAQEQAQQQHLLTLRSHMANGAQQALSLYGTGATPDQVRGEVTNIMQNAGAQPDAIKQAIMDVPDDPTKIDAYLVKQAQVGLSGSEQLLSKFPNISMTNFGGAVAPVSQGNQATAAQAPGQVTNQFIPLGITPSERQTVGTDVGGRPIVVSKDAYGAVTNVKGAPVQGQSTTTPFVMPTGESADTLKIVQNMRANSNAAAATVPQQMFNTNQIIHYAKIASTGTGSQILNNLKGQFAGLPWTSDSAANYNMLGHAIALQTASLANSAGLNGSNEARGLAQEQTANQNWTKDAVITSARNMRALATGANLFNQGMENSISKEAETKGPSASQFAARTFQNSWSRVANVDSMRLYDAYKNKADDPEGLKSVVDELGGQHSDRYKQALKSVDSMKELIGGK
jgi:hypothetical protein